MHLPRGIRRLSALVAVFLFAAVLVTPVLAHEEREVDGYEMEVGFMNEPVFVGDKSGLEFFVNKDGQPVTGLEKTLKAEVIYGRDKRDLPVDARFGEDGAYESVFIPTAAGKYTFHIYGTLPDGLAMDESFTSSADGFGEVQELAAGQFPVQFPSQAELVDLAKKGSDAASQTTIALALGVIGLIVGIAALGIALASRSRAR